MHYGIEIVTLGEFGRPQVVVKLAQAAEAAGWEGLFIWDHLAFVWGVPCADPWVLLAAVAQATTRLKLGTAVTPLARHRPHVLANTLTTLDQLSGGRVIFGAGLGGVPEEFAAFGEPADTRQRAAMLDEGLDVLNQLWSGEKVSHHGRHYLVDGVALVPRPVQRPRIPVWIGGESRPALRRSARWDGWVIAGIDQEGQMTKTAAEMADKVAYIGQHRTSDAAFDVALTGHSTLADGGLVGDFAAAGVTWWLESLHGYRGSVDEMLERVAAGPPPAVRE